MDPVDVIQPVVAMTVQQETNPKHEKLRVQARTLFVKNVMYQRRNVGTNLCLLGSPIVFCTLLLLVQVALRKLLTGEDFEVSLSAALLTNIAMHRRLFGLQDAAAQFCTGHKHKVAHAHNCLPMRHHF